jgi:hypothetical protein
VTLRLQPNAWSCGPTALYNALQTMGIRCGLQTLCRLSCVRRDMADYDTTAGLRMAARHYCVDLLTEFCSTRENLREAVRLRTPMLLCVDRDSEGPYAHWIATLRGTARHVWIADSARPGPVEHQLTWNQFLDRAAAVEGGEIRYAFHPLVRRSRP